MEIAIEINGIKWRVFIVDSTHKELVGEDGKQDAYGITMFRECEIYIDGGVAPSLFKQIVTHELVHAIAFSYGESIELEGEENICNFIAAHFDELKQHRKSILKAA